MTYQPKYKWAYGITAVPDRGSTLLKQTIESLAGAGFDHPTVFVDGGCQGWTPPADLISQLVIRHPNIGCFANWCCSLLQLYHTNHQSDFYALFEDDLLACRNLLEYLEATILSPDFPNKTYWNLATHDQNLVLSGGRSGWYPSNQKGRGAVALVFDQQGVKDLIGSKFLVEVPHNSNTDGCIMQAMVNQGYTEYVHSPSLVDHVGQISTLGHNYGRFKAWGGDGWDPFEYEGLQ